MITLSALGGVGVALLLTIGLLSAVQVITSANPVHAVFFLVLVFIVTSVLRLVLSREFRALVFLRVYVGAIAVLFLFVVRRLNVGVSGSNESPRGNIPRLLVLGGLFLRVILNGLEIPSLAAGELHSTLPVLAALASRADLSAGDPLVTQRVSSRVAIGQVLYTTYCVEFLRAGVVLLVARVGAIVLTLSNESSDHRFVSQQVAEQHSRDSDRAVFRVS
jgi:NADH-quinone oxidoreductase subunit J